MIPPQRGERTAHSDDDTIPRGAASARCTPDDGTIPPQRGERTAHSDDTIPHGAASARHTPTNPNKDDARNRGERRRKFARLEQCRAVDDRRRAQAVVVEEEGVEPRNDVLCKDISS